MKTRRIGQSGLQVSEVGLGSWLTLGSSVDPKGSATLVEQAFDLGVNFFDTADVYSEGAAEEVLGTALRAIPRQHVVLGTKCYFPMSERPNDRGLSRKHIFESVEASLQRLGTDYIDLHQAHRADPHTPMQETVRAYEDLIRQGKVLYWGVSEWSAAQISEACAIADATGGYRPISNQPNYSIMRRQIEAGVLPRCRKLGLGQLAFSPLGQGVLTGKYCGGTRPDGSRALDPSRSAFMQTYLEDEDLAAVERLIPLARGLGLTLAQLALAWCLRNPNVSCVIVGVTGVEQLQENCGAAGVALPEEVTQEIDRLFPPIPARRAR
jgi:voltage-dependent potassium channel beta subunit